MSELSESHCPALRLAQASRKAYHTGSKSGYSSWSSPLNRRKASLPSIARASLRPARSLVIPISKVGHALVPDPGRQRINDDQVQLIQIDRRLPVDATVSRPQRNLSGVRVNQPTVLVVVLIGQRAGDLRQIDPAQVKHQARIGRLTARAPEPKARPKADPDVGLDHNSVFVAA